MRTPPRTPRAGGPVTPPPVRGRRAHAGPPADETAEELAAAAAAARRTAPAGGGLRLRPRTVRAKVVSLLIVPVMSLLALWGHATVTAARDVAAMRQSERVDSQVRVPMAEAVTALQAERASAVRLAAGGDGVPRAEFRALTTATDRAVGRLRVGGTGTVADSGELPPEVPERLRAFLAGADSLRPVRSGLLDEDARWERTYRAYTGVIADALAVDGALTFVPHVREGTDARVMLELSRAGEALAQEDALLASARLDGSLDGERRALFAASTAARRALVASAAPDLREPQRGVWRALVHEGGHEALDRAEDTVLRAEPGEAAARAVPADVWEAAHDRVRTPLRAVTDHASHTDPDGSGPLTRALFTPAGAAVLLGLLAVAASLVVSVRIGRGIVADLVGLRNSALEIARRKLPQAMRKLRAGEEIDVHAEAPHGPPAEDETGQVAEALGTVHRAALRAAVERAELAGGISGVFVNLARRSQVLVHRQLALLDGMERRAEDPDELSDLFRLDHLTTRMRRHAESLIILSGAAPGRAWSRPVSLTNVVRAAASEIEDYARIDVRQLAETAVTGAAVADLTHLLAELVENAAQFSPPHTKVRVTGEAVGNGYALEVEDRGLGMGPETLADANRRIRQSEALDLFDSDRLGLFVVSRLAARHGIKVHLRPSPYGGTTAVVLLPTTLLHEEEGPAAGAGVPGRADDHGPARDAALPAAAGPRPERPAPAPAPARTEAEAEDRAGATGGPPPVDPPPGVTALRPRRAADRQRDVRPTGPFRGPGGPAPAARRASGPARSPVPDRQAPVPGPGLAPERAPGPVPERVPGPAPERAPGPARSPVPDRQAPVPGPGLAPERAPGTAPERVPGSARGPVPDRQAPVPGPGLAPERAPGPAPERAPGPAPDRQAPVPGPGLAPERAPGPAPERAPGPAPDRQAPVPAGGPVGATTGVPPALGTPPPWSPPESPATSVTTTPPGARSGGGPGTGGPGTGGPVTDGPAGRTAPAGGALPRRVRQRNLVPQLRQRPAASSAPAPPPAADRTPEEVRDRMAAYRDGWVRGGGRPPGRGPHRADHSDSSEGDPA